MKKCIIVIAFFLAPLPALCQNWTTVSSSNITDLNQQKLAAGQLCFLGTDQNDNPISFMVGGGGQVLKRQFCASVTNGASSTLTVPNPATTSPSGVSYRVTVKDSSTGQEVLRYSGVSFSGTTFNLDLYTPNLAGASMAPLTGTTVSGNLGVTGNISATGTIAASNLPASIPGTGSCSNQFVTALNTGAAPTCSTDLLASAQHANQGTATTLLHGNAAGNPSWAGVSLTADAAANQGTATTVLHGNGAGQPSFGAVALTTDVSGVLPPANGGTGATSAVAAFDALSPSTTLGDIIFHNGTDDARLAGNTTTTKKYLQQVGTGR